MSATVVKKEIDRSLSSEEEDNKEKIWLFNEPTGFNNSQLQGRLSNTSNIFDSSIPFLMSAAMIKQEDDPLLSPKEEDYKEKIRSLETPTKIDNLQLQSRLSNSSNSKRDKYSSVTDINRLSGGDEKEVNDVNRPSSVVFDTTTGSLMYPVVQLIKDQCCLCKDSFDNNHSLTHLVRNVVHVCRMTADNQSQKMIVAESSIKKDCSQRKSEITKHQKQDTLQDTSSSPSLEQSNESNDNIMRRMPNGKHSQARKKSFDCTWCSFQCNLRSGVVRHMRRHTGEKPFACALCTYKCNNNSSLTRHMRRHTGDKFACTMCSYQCKLRYSLTTHMRSHTGENLLACTLCSYQCYNRSDFGKHMRRHSGERKLACTKCSFKCNDSSSLTRHMRRHTGEKPFACTICPYKSRNGSDLARHARRHTGEKPFACNLCSHRCSQRGNLTSHMRSHTDVK